MNMVVFPIGINKMHFKVLINGGKALVGFPGRHGATLSGDIS